MRLKSPGTTIGWSCALPGITVEKTRSCTLSAEIIEEGIPAEQVTEDTINERLYSVGIPDPDLVIRTAGEMRLSNFLIWQSSYAELYVTSVFWPDFDKEELRKALDAYAARDRRYGRLPGGDEGSKTSHA